MENHIVQGSQHYFFASFLLFYLTIKLAKLTKQVTNNENSKIIKVLI